MGILSGRSTYDRKQILRAAAQARARGKHRRAAELYRQVLVVEPENAELHARIAPHLALTCQDYDAWASYRVAAHAHVFAKRPERALAVYRDAARLLPRQVDAWKAIAKLEARLGRKREAIETLLAGRRHFTGAAYRAQAITLLRRARKIEPWDSVILLDLSRTLAANDQRYEALMILEQLATRTEGGDLAEVRAAEWRITHSLGHALQWIQSTWSALRAGTYADRASRAPAHENSA
ncbi:MAG: hypothetical protein JRG96_02485 [Deltaproteobacteria bacterium]|nr:hypothetical protein [Deltaproteobacteria bacterium]MBW2417997.1 hypothetical protein [Deltaproteobacteria bacterium]